jgi:hypothetical protein
MGWQTGTAPCQSTPAPKPGVIPETCPSGEEPPEANSRTTRKPEGNPPPGSRRQPATQEQLHFADPQPRQGTPGPL